MQPVARRTTVVRLQKSKKRNPNEVYVGRPSRWGNPFVIGKDGTREEVIAKHRAWIKTQPRLLADIPDLIGKQLACYCAPLACHGDTLAQLANAASGQLMQPELLDAVEISATGPAADTANGNAR